MSAPVPHDSTLLDWSELSEEEQGLFIEGCELFDQAEFWHAHESWEDLWKGLKPRECRAEIDVVQGMIQRAALLYNYERSKVRGVVNMASKLIRRLDGVEHGIWGVDIARLRVELTPFIRDAAADEPKWGLPTDSVKLIGGWKSA